jgi:hypothetical protein
LTTSLQERNSMPIPRFFPRRAAMRDLIFLSTPNLWPLHPYLPVIRRSARGNCQQLGVVYDGVGASGLYGYSATVFLTNLFMLPQSEAALLALPRCVYDTPDELVDDGWVVD